MALLKRTARKPEPFVRIAINNETPDVYKNGWREFLLTTDQASRLLADLRDALAAGEL